MNRLTRITTTLTMFWAILAGRVICSGNEEIEQLFKFSTINNTLISPTAILLESDKFKLENYTNEKTQYIFIKNLSSGNGDAASSSNTTDIILAIESKKFFEYNDIFTCFYTEVKGSEDAKNKYVPYTETTTENKKKILIVPNSIPKQKILIDRIEHVKKQLNFPEKTSQIKKAIDLMEIILNQMICRFYVDNFMSGNNTNIEYIKNHLKEIGICNKTVCALLSREETYNGHEDLAVVFRKYAWNTKYINRIVEKNKLVDPITYNSIYEIDPILIKIKSREKTYSKPPTEYQKRMFGEDMMLLINILTNGRLDFHMCINREKLKKQIEEVKEVEIRDRLFKAVDRCEVFPKKKINMNMLWKKMNTKEIENEKQPSYYVNPKILKLNSSCKEEPKSTEDYLAIKANEVLSCIINSGKIELDIDVELLINEIEPWNKDLVNLLVEKITRYSKFKGSTEELREYIITASTEIVSNIEKNKQKYNGYKNISMMQKILENGVVEIMNILENQKKNANLQREIIARENKLIIKILGNMSIKNDIPEEQNPQYKQKKQEIQNILSEIAEEFTKPEDYSITDKVIQAKKQEIVDLVFKKLLITEDIDALRMKTKIKEIVKGVINTLVDRTIDYSQYKGFATVEKEIRMKEEYIKSQNLDDILGSIFELIGKYGYVLGYDDIFHIVNEQFILVKSISSMENYFRGEHDEIEKWTLSDISMDKICTFFAILDELNEMRISIDILEFYNILWLNPAFLILDIQNSFIQKDCQAFIYYKSISADGLSRKRIELTNENLQSFKDAKIAKDIEAIKSKSS